MAVQSQTPKTAAKLGYKASFQNALQNILTYKWRAGMLAWMLHRITGIGMMLYLTIHVIGLRALYDPVLFDALMSSYRNPLFKIGEISLLGAVAYHSINGFRVVMVDFLGWSPKQKRMFYASLALAVIIVGLGAFPILAPYFLN
ncbi:MAG: succinate dehydrogenase, cytochrome b556 subunit [Rhizobacter sp.]|nr:succinate dehydrogenase, cytochrome b556 subunit [Chlorobiales bacterium]